MNRAGGLGSAIPLLKIFPLNLLHGSIRYIDKTFAVD
jgi:hypothetical protein